jgi:fluoride ion exporter CrcB/FEX
MQRRGITSLRYFLLPGFCGGLGTFSAVTYEVIAPGEGGFTYLFLNVILSLFAVVLSLRLTQKIMSQR